MNWRKWFKKDQYYWCANKVAYGDSVVTTAVLSGISEFQYGTPIKTVVQSIYTHATTQLANEPGKDVFIISLNKV